MNLQQHKQKLLKSNSEFRKEYNSYDLAFEIGQMILEARSIKGITQKRLAEMIDTKQSGIARAESGNYLPSLSFLDKIAKALKTHLFVRFGFMLDSSSKNVSATISGNEVFLTDEAVRENFLSFKATSSFGEASPNKYQYLN